MLGGGGRAEEKREEYGKRNRKKVNQLVGGKES